MNHGELKRGNICLYTATRPNARPVLVKVTDFGRTLIVTEGIDDGRRRDVPVSRLQLAKEKDDG